LCDEISLRLASARILCHEISLRFSRRCSTYLNVSPNAVRSWEQGTLCPRQAALELLAIAKQNPKAYSLPDRALREPLSRPTNVLQLLRKAYTAQQILKA
jgi:hypothetical protein